MPCARKYPRDVIDGLSNTLAFGSRAFSWHPKFCNFVFRDGSVRAISEAIDTDFYQPFGGMTDGRAVGFQGSLRCLPRGFVRLPLHGVICD